MLLCSRIGVVGRLPFKAVRWCSGVPPRLRDLAASAWFRKVPKPVDHYCRLRDMRKWSSSWIQQVSLNLIVETIPFLGEQTLLASILVVRQALFATAVILLVHPGHDKFCL